MRFNEASEQKIRNTVEEILKRREFRTSGTENPIADFIRRIWESFLEWLKGLFGNRTPRRNIQIRPDLWDDKFQNILKLVLVIAAAAVLFFLIRLLVKKIVFLRKGKNDRIPSAHDYLENPDEVMEHLKAFMEKKEYVAALRFLFIAVLLELHERKTIHIEKWKTNRAYLREIDANAKELFESIAELNALFNACCYGNRTVDEEKMNRWFAFFSGLRERST